MDFVQIDYDNNLNCTINLKGLKQPNKPTTDIAVDAVKRITQYYPPPYTLFASGGVDSQAMIWSWYLSGVDFNVVTVCYENNFNRHDIKNLEEFCKTYSIPLNYLNFEVLAFLENMEEYVVKYKCISPHICTHMAFSNLVPEGTVLFSGNPLFLPKPPYYRRITYLSNTVLGLHRFSQISRPTLIPFFLHHDYGLAPAFDRNNEVAEGLPGYEYKCKIYQNHGFPVVAQQQKYTGFEIIKDWCDDNLSHRVTNEMKNKYKFFPSKRTFDILYRYRWTDVVKYKEEITYVY